MHPKNAQPIIVHTDHCYCNLTYNPKGRWTGFLF